MNDKNNGITQSGSFGPAAEMAARARACTSQERYDYEHLLVDRHPLTGKWASQSELDAIPPAPAPDPWAPLLAGWVTSAMTLPAGSADRKAIPLYSGVVAYAPAALACVAIISKLGNDQHNPGQPLHHARSKSADHLDCELRHLVDGGDEPDELKHAAAKAWRALIDLQLLCERLGAPMAPGARK